MSIFDELWIHPRIHSSHIHQHFHWTTASPETWKPQETTQEQCKPGFVQVGSCTTQNQGVSTISEQQPFPTKWPGWGQGTSPQLKRIQSPGGTNHFSFQCIPGLLEMKCMTSDLLPLLYWVVWIHLNTINANCNLQTDWKGRKRRKTENIICILIRHSSIGHSRALLVFFPVFRWIVFWQGFKDCVVKCVNGTNRGIKRFPCRSKLSRIRCKPRLAVSCGNMLDGKGKGCEGNNAKTFHNAWNISVNWGPLFSEFL